MTIKHKHGVLIRPPENLRKVYYSQHNGLCVEYKDATGYHILSNVKSIEV